MKPSRVNAGEAPVSAFVQEMRAAFTERCAVSAPEDKRRVEREMQDIMRRHLGPVASRAHGGVPRGTPASTDRKMAAAGVERD